ncbi:unnamed protein product [Thelazia callipaeda]|uniref:Transmembrane protein 208 n=1 Tax=Thelazia callipaeda TaxID=103827 RepID=A0A0N5CVR3_THECL|nr:unnamed protein product [Thelazia callipaeda]
MNIGAKSGKAATRGQKQIHEENRTVLLHYSVASLLSSVSNLFILQRFGFSICSILQGVAILTMRSMAHCRRNDKGQVTDAGLDLNQPDAFGENCKDVVIVCSLVATIAAFWSRIFWLLFIIPAYIVYKLWVTILAPWFFAEPVEQEGNEKRLKRREKRLRKA